MLCHMHGVAPRAACMPCPRPLHLPALSPTLTSTGTSESHSCHPQRHAFTCATCACLRPRARPPIPHPQGHSHAWQLTTAAHRVSCTAMRSCITIRATPLHIASSSWSPASSGCCCVCCCRHAGLPSDSTTSLPTLSGPLGPKGRGKPPGAMTLGTSNPEA